MLRGLHDAMHNSARWSGTINHSAQASSRGPPRGQRCATASAWLRCAEHPAAASPSHDRIRRRCEMRGEGTTGTPRRRGFVTGACDRARWSAQRSGCASPRVPLHCACPARPRARCPIATPSSRRCVPRTWHGGESRAERRASVSRTAALTQLTHDAPCAQTRRRAHTRRPTKLECGCRNSLRGERLLLCAHIRNAQGGQLRAQQQPFYSHSSHLHSSLQPRMPPASLRPPFCRSSVCPCARTL